eukprot:NODE_865_length_1268_cov_242.424938_g660_i0.p1 GENE.NODE_865_length_1268_cov_242.424938_g660_i0~~NODE_865_length_1268_cov_242.424938_g660_i0.p1  ORF type:complete len:215 (-),score=28.28 NODE_865_length_1268_cov_242.424938_g660_i0:549-1193(-)
MSKISPKKKTKSFHKKERPDVSCLQDFTVQLQGNCQPDASHEGPTEIIPGFLWLGTCFHGEDFDWMKSHDVRYVINAARECKDLTEQAALNGLEYLKLDLTEKMETDFLPKVALAVQFIDRAQASNLGVLLHCRQGISRSGAVAIAYVMMRANLKCEQAVNFVKKKKVLLEPGFRLQLALQELDDMLHSSASCPLIAMRHCIVPRSLQLEVDAC